MKLSAAARYRAYVEKMQATPAPVLPLEEQERLARELAAREAAWEQRLERERAHAAKVAQIDRVTVRTPRPTVPCHYCGMPATTYASAFGDATCAACAGE